MQRNKINYAAAMTDAVLPSEIANHTSALKWLNPLLTHIDPIQE